MKTILGALVFVLALTLGLGAWARTDTGEFLVPDAESVVQKMLGHMQSGRYGPARATLDNTLAEEMGEEGLHRLDQALKDKFGQYTFELGGKDEREGDRSTYRARVRLGPGNTEEVPFELERDAETGFWHITSLAGLEGLVETK